ncbi:MAG: sulfatase-like hydrolase/transferase [Lentisphaerae bacterium]|jgi:choline-sulfatase|nr:sulfatase-like hydrolase/transferase [Lentisphaerota bacterium]MBT4817240.1 sulfatase-like hydrolase/transferase [Lentisphaerota bacterium]MBT5606745.1 sulfatase-like hydrolase/transferase [Lentisphaerota bacterium]MBT7057576.1 sulfatase-like hydrolase/transferase [Lentisphaerota bacterium]MBT7842897.1 sulfatase-like hydrolase/transferase [Lentisphaerota bacterium]
MSDRPNVLFILTDDQGYWSLGSYGNAEIRTPCLDAIAASGMRFENMFCASPVCSPARASLVTGRIPSQHGVHDWIRAGDVSDETVEPGGKGRTIEYLAGQTGYTDFLAAGGYQCGMSGKWHLGDSHHAQKGFEFWEVHAKGGGPYYNAPMVHNGEIYRESGYVTDVITDNALAFLETTMHDARPFYLSVHYTAPHSPWQRDQHPTEIFESYYDHCPFDSVPDGLEPPEWAEHLSIPVKDAETRRNYLSGYYAAITAMDTNVGRIVDWLDEHGERENTLICFTSDNGMNMGHHGVYGKGNATFPMNMYEESVKVPFLMSWPDRIAAGRVCSELLSHYDFMPTLLDCVGVPNPDAASLPGQSFAGVLGSETEPPRDQVVVFDEYGPVRMIRTRSWKYIHRYPHGPNEMYDLVNDPSESENLVDIPDHGATRIALKGRLDNWFLTYVDPALDGTHEDVTGSGQLDLAGPASRGRVSFAADRRARKEKTKRE